MPKTITLDTFKGRLQLWATVDPEDMQVMVSYEISGGGVSQNKSKDVTPSLTAAQRKAILDFAKALIAAAKAQEGM